MQTVVVDSINIRLFAIVVGALLLSANTYAQDTSGQDEESADPKTNLFSDPKFSLTDVAEMWNLSIEEVERFQRLSEVDKPFTAPGATMTPYEVLGKFARTPDERVRYARMYAKAANDNHTRGLEWVIALEGQMTPRKAREAELIDSSDIIGNRVRAMGLRMPSTADLASEVDSYASSVDAVFYVPTPCEEDCTAMFKSLRSGQIVNKIGTIQVVFTDLEDSETGRERVYRWAADHDLSTKDVGRDKSIRISFESSIPAFAESRNNRKAPLAIDPAGKAIH